MCLELQERRKTLAKNLLIRLKEVRDHIQSIMENLGDSRGEFMSVVYEDHYGNIMEKIGLYNKNIDKIAALNLKHTSLITSWFLLIKDQKALSSLLFPFRFYSLKRKTTSEILKIKEEISGIGIKNRLIREDIQRLESGLEYEATLRLKKDVRYEDYLTHLKLKSQLVREIEYLFPTLSGIDRAQIHMDKLEEAIEALNLSMPFSDTKAFEGSP